MNLRVVVPEGKFYAFHLLDEDDQKVGELYANEFATDHVPTTQSLSRFQGSKICIDGRSLKRLGRKVDESKIP